MSSERITISVPAAVAARIKKAAGNRPVSAWVTGVIDERLDDAELERRGASSTGASTRVGRTRGELTWFFSAS